MKDLSSLIAERNSLPKGKIYIKTIKGREYFYHQYSFGGKKYTKAVKKEELEDLRKKIDRRIELDIEIKVALEKRNRNIKLSRNAISLTGSVMKGDEVVASFEKGSLIYIDEDKCPYIIKRTHRLEPFLQTRVIDAGRTNSRLLKKALSISSFSDQETSLASYAASITDNYWFKPLHSKLKYKDIAFNNDLFFGLSLKGLISFFPGKIVLTPELVTRGGYEKGWKLVDNEWWLYKVGTKEEIFSELFYSHLFELLSLPTAHYEYENGYIKTKNFASSYAFEPIIGLVGEDDSYEHVFALLKGIRKDIASSYLLLCYFDVLLNNVDRHNENYGVLRDLESGELLSLAPNYDDNLSLVARDKNVIKDPYEGFYKQFVNLLKNNDEIRNFFKEMNIPLIHKKTLEKCYNDLGFDLDIDKELLFDFVLKRQEGLLEAINNQHISKSC